MEEKSLNQLAPDLRRLFTKGNEALQRDNFDYALEMFNQVLDKEPGLHECRKLLRVAQLKKASGGSGFFKKAFSLAGIPSLLAKGELALHNNPVEALTIAEQALNSDPNNSSAHRLIVKAAVQLQMPRTALLSLQLLNINSPKDKEIAIQYARCLADVGEIARGEKVLEELQRFYPVDNEITEAIKNLSALKTLDEGGYDDLADGSGSYRDILKDKEEAVTLEQQNRVQTSDDVTDRLIREYEARLQNEPRNLKLVRDLAELYAQKKQFDKSFAYYDRLKASDLGNDASLDRTIADTRIKKLDFEASQLDTTAPDYPERFAQLQTEKQAFQLAECQKRVERFPTDLAMRFELGQLYFQAGKVGEAIQEFQKSQNNPNKRIASMSYLAQCFAKRRMFDLAARTLQNALKEKLVFDDEKKELIYNLGSVLESMGKKADAIEQFKLIYEVDISYKDVAARVDAYYASQG